MISIGLKWIMIIVIAIIFFLVVIIILSQAPEVVQIAAGEFCLAIEKNIPIMGELFEKLFGICHGVAS
jgi:hypothetical protein